MTAASPAMTEQPADAALRRALVRHLGAIEMTVTGTCMAPELAEGRHVRLVPLQASPRFGEVVLVETAAGPRLHRVILAVPGLPLRTKGDRSPAWDAPVERTAVIARLPGARGRWRAARSLVGALAFRLRTR